MSLKLSPLALAAIGLARKLSGAQSESEVGESSSGMDFDGLVEAGEEAFDEFLSGMTKARTEFADNARKFASEVLSDLGVATRKEIEDLRKALDKDQQAEDTDDDAAN